MREPGGVQHDLLDGDAVLLMGTELREVLDDWISDSQRSFGNQGPCGRGHERLGRREDAIAIAGPSGAEGFRRDDLACVAQSDLAGRKQTLVDFPACSIHQLRELRPVDGSHAVELVD
jgi:hypothetical protein